MSKVSACSVHYLALLVFTLNECIPIVIFSFVYAFVFVKTKPFLDLKSQNVLMPIRLGEWHGLAVSIEACHSKGRGFETAPSPLLFSERSSSKLEWRNAGWFRDRWPILARRKAERKAEAATSRFESGMVYEKWFGSFRKRLNGQRQARNDMVRKI